MITSWYLEFLLLYKMGTQKIYSNIHLEYWTDEAFTLKGY